MTKIAPAAADSPLLGRLRDTRWIAHPGTYVLSSPLIGILGVGASLMIPALLGPAEFGRYTVAELIGRYLVIADLGLLLILDRRVPPLLAAGDTVAADHITQHVLWTRVVVGVGLGAAFFVGAVYLKITGRLEIGLPAALFSGAFGILWMIAHGPVGAWRASSHYRPLALSSALLNLGLSVPRVVGAWIGGVTGCFLSLSVWSGSCIAIFYPSLRLRASSCPPFRTGYRLLAESLPLFAASFGWSLYLPENRWVYALIAGPTELGRFAFGASIVMVLVTAISMPASVYYPKLVGRIATAPAYAFSAKLLRDLSMLTIGSGACCLCAVVVLPVATEFVYPRFVDAVLATRILLASGSAFVLASWLMPLIVAIGKRPWLDAFAIYPASLLGVAVGIVGGHAAAGMTGAAAGSVMGSLVCPALQLIVLWRSAVVRIRHAVILMILITAATGALAVCTVALGLAG